MATITLFADGTVEARYACGVCVYIDVKTFADKGKTILHSYDTLGIHGTPKQIRAFAQAILAALPPPPALMWADEMDEPEHPPEPEPDPPYPDAERDDPWIDKAAAALDRFDAPNEPRDAGELFERGRRLVEAPGSDLLHG